MDPDFDLVLDLERDYPVKRMAELLPSGSVTCLTVL